MELFAVCDECESSTYIFAGAKKFKENGSPFPYFVSCSKCQRGFEYDNDKQNCMPCHMLHSSACDTCNKQECLQCHDGYFLQEPTKT